MLYVCISFDYELFMGENRVSEDKVLFQPTQKLASMLKKSGVSATFFADVCCPEAYRRLGQPAFADAFDMQLQELLRSGHDVQLHIHPHWKVATEVGKIIQFPREFYRIHNWVGGDGDFSPVREMIHEGTVYLNRILQPVKPEYRCLAFRAGGYCIQPEKLMAESLYQEGIRIDSSVCQGMSYSGNGMYYDYRTEPTETNVYISKEYGLADNVSHPVKNGVLEVPVAGYSTFPYRLIASKKNKNMGSVADLGWGMSLTEKRQPSRRNLINRIKKSLTATNMLTFDSYSADAMCYMLKRIAHETKGKDAFISVIAHPKVQTDTRIENMRQVVETLQRDKNIQFVSMSQMAGILKL